jgi:hypothetical protein
MTVDEAAAAMGVQLRRESGGEDDWECAFASFATISANSPVFFMTAHDRIEAVLVSVPDAEPGKPAPLPVHWPRILTPEGIGLGDTGNAVRRAYTNVQRETAPYDGEPSYDLYHLNGAGRGLRFDANDAGVITKIHAGNEEWIRLWEGCQ